jgi:hypothetical protein
MKPIKQGKLYLIILVMLGVVVVCTGMASAALSDPGSEDDPLVTLSYVEKRIEQIRFYIDQKVQELTEILNNNSGQIQTVKKDVQKLLEENSNLLNRVDELEQSKGASQPKLEVVELRNGQKLICKAGTEIILRGGKAIAIGSELGGLSDVTGATDLQTGHDIPANHLLIVPRNDGRGVYVEEYAIFMIRGEYEIK